MKANDIKERIAKLNEKITKKNALIEKKTTMIKKFEGTPTIDELLEMTERDDAWHKNLDNAYKISNAKESIASALKEIEKANETLVKYEKQLGDAEKKENEMNNLPDPIKELKEFLIEKNYEIAISYKTKMKEKKSSLTYKEFINKYGYGTYEFILKADDEIKKESVRSAENIIENTMARTYEITGEVISWNNVRIAPGANRTLILNGVVEGKKGNARLESIYAGGYNIQKLHVRVLVSKA